jgi:hypothetical protein
VEYRKQAAGFIEPGLRIGAGIRFAFAWFAALVWSRSFDKLNRSGH